MIVWQKAIDFVEAVYRLPQAFPSHEQFGLSSQLRRSSVSVASNIAEGQARQHSKEFRQFLHISLGSLAEAHTQLIIANRLNYLSKEGFGELGAAVKEIRKMLYALIKTLPTAH